MQCVTLPSLADPRVMAAGPTSSDTLEAGSGTARLRNVLAASPEPDREFYLYAIKKVAHDLCAIEN
jgi:hypothetical protein